MHQRLPIFREEKLHAEFELNGFLVLNLLGDEQVEELLSQYNSNYFGNPSGFYSTSFCTDNKLKAELEEKVEEVVGAEVKKVFLPFRPLGSCYLSKAPGIEGAMPLHQDWTVVDESKFDSITIWIALQAVNQDNGALQVIPGSHRFSKVLRSPFYQNPLSEIENELRADLVTVNLKAGQAIVFSQALMHCSPANMTTQPRLAVTYGLIHSEAQLLFYIKNDQGKGEKYQVPIDFFKQYNTQIGAKPTIGTLVESFDLTEHKVLPAEYFMMQQKFKQRRNKKNEMKPIFKNPTHQSFFETQGYLVLPLLEAQEIDDLKNYYESLNLKDENGFGFHVSMDSVDKDQCIRVREKLWGTILPKLDSILENYKPFVASFVVKESNPKGVVPAHQDWSFVDKEEEGFCSITCWTTLVDTNLNNGCMGVIKGSSTMMQNHRPSPSPQAPVPLSEHMFSIFPYLGTLEMKAGEVLFFDNRTFHASPPNTEKEVRLAAGIGVTQKDAQLIHYFLKPDGKKDTLLKYQIDEDFFLKYSNGILSKMYDEGKTIEDYPLMNELPYRFENYSAEQLVHLIKDAGNEFNVPMCEKLSVLFGYDMSGKKQEPAVSEQPNNSPSYRQKFAPKNLIRVVKSIFQRN
jgi:ectoine hydroxylase-related dioxygenase (phytanoyl-CoA dioxygenase family)